MPHSGSSSGGSKPSPAEKHGVGQERVQLSEVRRTAVGEIAVGLCGGTDRHRRPAHQLRVGGLLATEDDDGNPVGENQVQSRLPGAGRSEDPDDRPGRFRPAAQAALGDPRRSGRAGTGCLPPNRRRSNAPTAGRCPTSTTARAASQRNPKQHNRSHVQSPKPSWTSRAVAGLLADGSTLLGRPSRSWLQWSPHRRTGTDEGEQLPAHSGEGRVGFSPTSRAPRQTESSARFSPRVQPCALMADLPPETFAPDRCPGVLRPHLAADGALVRLRSPGGQVPDGGVHRLSAAAGQFADGDLHLTSRGNVQIRGISIDENGAVPEGLVQAVSGAGFLPSASHERVRNIVASPLSGRFGGLADIRPLIGALDEALCREPALADLPGRFLFGLDDGRGDVAALRCDLAAVAVDARSARLTVGDLSGPTLPLPDVVDAMIETATAVRRGTGDAVARAATSRGRTRNRRRFNRSPGTACRDAVRRPRYRGVGACSAGDTHPADGRRAAGPRRDRHTVAWTRPPR